MKIHRFVPLFVLVTGCAAMEAVGLSTADGQPTDVAKGLSGMIEKSTGISLLMLWKAGEALLTKRGRDNLANVGNIKSGFISSIQSLLSILVGSHTPESAAKKK